MIKGAAKEYLNDLKTVIDSLNIDEFENFIEKLMDAYKGNQQIFTFGNGGSGSTASHFVCDIGKGVSSGNGKRLKVLCLNDNIPSVLAYANDMDYSYVFLEQLRNYLNPGDLVLGISGSGNSQNVLKAFEYANEKEAKTFAVTGFDGGKLKKIAQHALVVDSFDMQKVEDIHMILVHMTMQILQKKIDQL